MFQNCLKPNSGLTLVEVIFSLALVGTLMVTLLIAHRRHTDQLALAEKQLVAIDALDQMMLAFYNDGNAQVPTKVRFEQATGEVPGKPKLRWRRFVRNEGTAGGRIAEILRVEVYNSDFLDGKTLADVELIVSMTIRPDPQ